MSLLCLFATFALLMIFTVAWAQENDGGPSVLHPQAGNRSQFVFHVDAIDPSAASNPKGVNSPGFRAEQQLVVYTPAYGGQTQTNRFGAEAIVENGRITGIATGNSAIPPSGFVISGHGQSGTWIKNTLKVGMAMMLDPSTGQITTQMTPEVYLNQVDGVLAQTQTNLAKAPNPLNTDSLQDAEACRDQLARLMAAKPDNVGPWPRWTQICLQKANAAFYQSIPAKPDEFRGIWVRAVEHTPQEVARSADILQSLGIQNVFLETYYQGLTLYPSQVMQDYHLPHQHGQFEGWDPLAAWADALKARNMKLHLWVQTYFAGDTHTALETYGPILQTYPQWRNIQRSAVNRSVPVASNIEDGHFFLDPANTDVQTFLNKLILEMLAKYHPDGLNLDYIRYPASVSPNHSQFLASTWGYTDTARKAFQVQLNAEDKAAREKRIAALKAEYAEQNKPVPEARLKVVSALPKIPLNYDPLLIKPSTPLWTRWVNWREDQVSNFVKRIHQEAIAQNPAILVSAVVFLPSDPLLQVKLQNWPQWVQQGDIAALTPIGLEENPKGLLDSCQQYLKLTQLKVPVYPGIFGMYLREPPSQLLTEINTVHQAGMPGMVLFEKSRLNSAYIDALKMGPFRETATSP